jgi:hypothetical protein
MWVFKNATTYNRYVLPHINIGMYIWAVGTWQQLHGQSLPLWAKLRMGLRITLAQDYLASGLPWLRITLPQDYLGWQGSLRIAGSSLPGWRRGWWVQCPPMTGRRPRPRPLRKQTVLQSSQIRGEFFKASLRLRGKYLPIQQWRLRSSWRLGAKLAPSPRSKNCPRASSM